MDKQSCSLEKRCAAEYRGNKVKAIHTTSREAAEAELQSQKKKALCNSDKNIYLCICFFCLGLCDVPNTCHSDSIPFIKATTVTDHPFLHILWTPWLSSTTERDEQVFFWEDPK